MLKIANFGIFRHKEGGRWNRRIIDIKIKWVQLEPPGAEKLIFSNQILACSIDCAPKCTHMYRFPEILGYDN